MPKAVEAWRASIHVGATFKLDRDSLAKKLYARCGVYKRGAAVHISPLV
jgi:hypothetical protein